MALRPSGTGVRTSGGRGLVSLPVNSGGVTASYCAVFCVPTRNEQFAFAYCRPIINKDGENAGQNTDVPVSAGTNRPIIFRTSGYTHLAFKEGTPGAELICVPLEDNRS